MYVDVRDSLNLFVEKMVRCIFAVFFVMFFFFFTVVVVLVVVVVVVIVIINPHTVMVHTACGKVMTFANRQLIVVTIFIVVAAAVVPRLLQ